MVAVIAAVVAGHCSDTALPSWNQSAVARAGRWRHQRCWAGLGPRGAALCAPRYVAFHSINPAADTASVAAHNTVHRHRGRKMTGAALVNERTLGMGLNTAYWLRLGRICFMRCWCVWVSVQGRCPQDEWWWWCQLPPALQTPVISDNTLVSGASSSLLYCCLSW